MPAVTPLLPEACLDQCPSLVRETLRVIGSKWAVPVLLTLLAASRPIRYAELRRRVGGITPKEMAKHLRSLESAGLVQRTVYPTVPPQVDYRLTGKGEATVPLLNLLAMWGARLRNPQQSVVPPCAGGQPAQSVARVASVERSADARSDGASHGLGESAVGGPRPPAGVYRHGGRPGPTG